MKRIQKLGMLLLVLLAMASLVLSGCSKQPSGTKAPESKSENTQTVEDAKVKQENQEESQEVIANSYSGKEKLKVGCVIATRPSVELMAEALKDSEYEVEIVLFDGNNLPAEALAADEIDGLFCNSLRWINTFNKEKNTNLQMPFPYYYSYGGLYSKKWKSIDEFPEGAKIVIANGITNIDGDLRILSNAGLIKLADQPTDGEYYSVIDIVDNPKKLELMPTELTTAMSAIDDVDAVIASASIVRDSGVMGADEYLAVTDREQLTPHGLIVAPEDVDAEWVKLTQEKFDTEEFYDMFNKRYEHTFILAKEIDEIYKNK